MENGLAPLLRLHKDLWTAIANYFEGSEAMRLLCIGNPVLSDRVRQATRRLSLTWSVARYMQLSDAFSTLNQFSNIWNFELTSDALAWTPINWTFLPSNLRHLKLSFPCAIHHLMSNQGLGSILPSLEVLKVEGLSHSLPTPARLRIDFRGLPSGLLELRLISPRTHLIHDEYLSLLPTVLTVLELRVAARLVTLDVFEGAPIPQRGLEAFPFPRLPDSITDLSIDDLASHVSIDAAKLPRSLTRFTDDRNSLLQDRLILTCAKERLTSLTELYISNGGMSVDDLHLLPTSITKLNLPIKAASLSEAVAQEILPKMVTFKLGKGYEDIVLTSKANNLEILYPVVHSETIIPSSVHTVVIKAGLATPLPRGLKQLEIIAGDDPLVLPTLLGNHLTTLWVYDFVDENLLLEWMPPSLVSLTASFRTKSWCALMHRMMTPALLNLTSIGSYNSFEAGAFQLWPPQLRTVRTILIGSLEMAPDSLARLRDSHLRSLELSIEQDEADQVDHFTALMEHLPRALDTFLATRCPAVSRPVTLPATLKRLDMTQRPDKTANESSSDSSLLIFPQVLRFLSLRSVPINYENLPPFLTEMVLKGQDKFAYFNERIASNSEGLNICCINKPS